MKRCSHVDSSAPQPLRESHRTPEGFLFCDAYPTRTGIFTYRYADGSIVRELRSRKDVADPASLATLGRKPVTNDHPREGVTPETAREVVVGAIGDTVSFDEESGYVRVQLALYAQDAIQAAEQGKQELSCGYECDVVPGSGWWDAKTDAISACQLPGHEPFDAQQKNIGYNHVAQVTRGRAGSLARLRADAMDTQLEQVTTMKIKIQDQEVEVVDVVAKEIERLQTEARKVDALQGQLDAVKRAPAPAPVKDMAWHRRRVQLETVATKLGIEKLDEKDDKALTVEILTKAEPTLKLDGKSEDYLAAFVDSMTRSIDAKVQELKELAEKKPEHKADEDLTELQKAQTEYDARIGWHASK